MEIGRWGKGASVFLKLKNFASCWSKLCYSISPKVTLYLTAHSIGDDILSKASPEPEG